MKQLLGTKVLEAQHFIRKLLMKLDDQSNNIPQEKKFLAFISSLLIDQWKSDFMSVHDHCEKIFQLFKLKEIGALLNYYNCISIKAYNLTTN